MDSSNLGWVYGLFDKEEGEDRIRYVGQTRGRDVRQRLYGHLHQARSDTPSSRPVISWIRSIGEDRVGHVILSQVPTQDLDKEEVWWIYDYRSRGLADLNVLDGGQGFSSNHTAGEKNSKARLTWELVRDLRSRAIREYVSVQETARKVGITPAALSKVLCNQTWYDPDYDPEQRISIKHHNENSADPVWRAVGNEVVEEMRGKYLSGTSVNRISVEYGIPKTTVFRCLFESYGSEETRRACCSKRGKPRDVRRRIHESEREEILRLLSEGLLQRQVAERFGVSQTRISQIYRSSKA